MNGLKWLVNVLKYWAANVIKMEFKIIEILFAGAFDASIRPQIHIFFIPMQNEYFVTKLRYG